MFNDNLLKMLVVLLLVGPHGAEADQQAATFHAFLAYTLPYVLLSLPAGVLADAFSKRQVLLTFKGVEAGAVLLAGLALMQGSSGALLAVLAVMGTLGALSSPTKYGLLAELVPEATLARSNGLFLTATWLATIVGTGLAGVALDALGRSRLWQLGVALGALSVGGLLLARRIPVLPARGVRRGIVETARTGWREICRVRSLRMAVIGSTTFWTLGALLQQDVVVYSKSELGLPDSGKSLLQAALAVGVGAGALICGYVTRGRLGVRWVHRGAALMGCVLIVLGLLHPPTAATVALLLVVGTSSGLLIVPLNSLAQGRSSLATRGSVIAMLNVFVFSGVILGSLTGAVLAERGFRSTTIFVVGGVAALAGAAWSRWARSRLDDLEPRPAAPA